MTQVGAWVGAALLVGAIAAAGAALRETGAPGLSSDPEQTLWVVDDAEPVGLTHPGVAAISATRLASPVDWADLPLPLRFAAAVDAPRRPSRWRLTDRFAAWQLSAHAGAQDLPCRLDAPTAQWRCGASHLGPTLRRVEGRWHWLVELSLAAGHSLRWDIDLPAGAALVATEVVGDLAIGGRALSECAMPCHLPPGALPQVFTSARGGLAWLTAYLGDSPERCSLALAP